MDRASTSPDGAPSPAQAFVEDTDHAVKRLQSRARGFLSRNCLFSCQAAMDVHLEAMQEQQKSPQEHDLEHLDQLIGRSEQRDYQNELEASRASLTRRINDLETGRYYLDTASQKKVHPRTHTRQPSQPACAHASFAATQLSCSVETRRPAEISRCCASSWRS